MIYIGVGCGGGTLLLCCCVICCIGVACSGGGGSVVRNQYNHNALTKVYNGPGILHGSFIIVYSSELRT